MASAWKLSWAIVLVSSLIGVAKAVPATPAATAAPQQILVTPAGTAQFDVGMSLFAQGQYGEALKQFSSWSKDFPRDKHREEVLYRIAECYRFLNKPTDAEAAYRFLLKEYPSGPFTALAQLREGDLLVQSEKYVEAIPLLQATFDSTKKDNSDPQSHWAAQYLLGIAQLRGKQEAAGRATLEEVLNNKESSQYVPQALEALADSEEKNGNMDSSLKYWERLLSMATKKETQARAAARGGYVALEQGNRKEAETLFETCRRLDPASQWRRLSNTGLLRIYLQQDRYQELLDLRQKEGEQFLDSSRSDLLFAVAHAQFKLGKNAPAVASFDLFLKEFPKHSAAPTAAYERLLARVTLSTANIAGDTTQFLAAYPKSPYEGPVLFLQAEDLSQRQKFAEALPLWQALDRRQDKDLPADKILFEMAQAYYETKNWIQAAEIYDRFCAKFPTHKLVLVARSRQALSLQSVQQNEGAANIWEKVRALALPRSAERQSALEQLGLLYGQLNKNPEMASVFKDLLAEYPDTRIKAFASYSVGVWAYNNKDYHNAETDLLVARLGDNQTLYLPSTERLVLLSYSQKNASKVAKYVGEYEKAADAKTPPLPPAIYFWLGQSMQGTQQYDAAIHYFTTVTANPKAADLLAAAWWRLAENQRLGRHYPEAAATYKKYRELYPTSANATEVLLGLAQCDLGVNNYDEAQSLAEQVLLQEVEGKSNALGRSILGEVLFAKGNYADAAKAFTTISLLYDDPQITPEAIKRAIESFEKANDTQAATEWRTKLKSKYPQFDPQS